MIQSGLRGPAKPWRTPTTIIGSAMPVFIAMLSILLSDVSATAAAPASDSVVDVSLVQLLATPEKFEGRRVRLKGFCSFGFEEQALYLHKEDSDQLNQANALWLESGTDSMNEKFVLVEGVFTAKSHGHLGAWPGEIQKITRFESAKSREDYRELLKKGPPPPRR